MRLYNFIKNKFNLKKSELKNFFLSHNILVDGKVAKEMTVVNENTIINIDGEIYRVENDYVYLAFNKPVGVTCTNDKEKLDSIINYINYSIRIFTIGRLDKDSHGLILLTNDQSLNNKLLGLENHVEKEYIVKTKEEIDQSFCSSMEKPILLDGKLTKPCVVRLVDNYTFDIILSEGRNRQIRRMAKINNRTVIDLCRIRFGNIKLDIPEGKYVIINKDNI